MMFILVGCFSVLLLYTLFKKRKLSHLKKYELVGKHVLITGGSSGIGKATAVLAAQMGANVTIIARDQEKLDLASRTIQQSVKDCSSQHILALSVDISGSYEAVEKAIEKASSELGPIYLLINCAGTSISQRFEDTTLDDFHRMLQINLIGSVAVTKAVLPQMKEHRQGRIVFVSSLAGLLGLYGYSAYSASKFALLGLAETLFMEVKPYNITVTVSYPPDTDTPGFEEEQKTKPIETQKICESGGLCSAETVADQLISDALHGRFSSVVGFEGLMVSTVCSGMMPFTSYLQLLFQAFTMGIFKLAGALFLWNWDRIVKECASVREKEKKVE